MGTQDEMCRNFKREYATNKLVQPDEKWPNDIKRALHYLNENLFDQEITIAKMREDCRIPQNNFSTRFKYYVGYTPASYIKYHRIQYSIGFIKHIKSSFSMSILAFEVGYEYPSTFGNAYKSVIGYSPKEYWKNQKKK